METWHAMIIVIILLLIYYFSKSESFISYMASFSEYGPQPLFILTRYIPNDVNGKISYPSLNGFTKSLDVLEIFLDRTFKTYSDDGFVREGVIPDYLWEYVSYLYDVAPRYNGKKYCQFTGKDMTYYYMWVNGDLIDLGIFAQNCVPLDLYPSKKLFALMDSDL